jgi:hypothetical protein
LASDNVLENAFLAIAGAFVEIGIVAIFLVIPGGDGAPEYSCQWGASAGGDNQHDTPSLSGCYRLK